MIKIDGYIPNARPPPKTPLLGGVGTVDGLIFGFVSRRVNEKKEIAHWV